MTTPADTVVMREPGSGRGTWAMSSLFEHLLESPPGTGRMGVALVTQPPGVATPLHRHTREAEAFYLLDGRIDYRAGEQDYDLRAGCFLYLPAGLPHAFRIRGDQPARFLAIVEPGGLLHLYDEVGIPATELRLPGPDGQTLEAEIPKWLEVSPQYGLEVVGRRSQSYARRQSPRPAPAPRGFCWRCMADPAGDEFDIDVLPTP